MEAPVTFAGNTFQLWYVYIVAVAYIQHTWLLSSAIAKCRHVQDSDTHAHTREELLGPQDAAL